MENPEMFLANVAELTIKTLRGRVVVRSCQRQALGSRAARELLGMFEKCTRHTLSARRRLDVQVFEKPDGPHGEGVR